MHKLKTVLRSPHRKRDSTSSQSPRQSYESSEAVSAHADHHTISPRHIGRSSLDTHQEQSQNGRRSRPVSSIYDDRRTSNASAPHYVPTGAPTSSSQTTSSESINGSIANDYKSYLPVLSPVDDTNGDSYLTMDGAKRSTTEVNNGRHEEEVADRNIERHESSIAASRNKPLPVPPTSTSTSHKQFRKPSTDAFSNPFPVSAVPSGISAKRDSVGQAITTVDDHVSSMRPHQEVSEHSQGAREQNGHYSQSTRNEVRVEKSIQPAPGSANADNRPTQLASKTLAHNNMAVEPAQTATTQHSTFDGDHDLDVLQSWKAQQKSLLNGVVDLTNTEDVDKDVQVAAPVVHEVVKPHEHEVIQRKIYREIHNYSYYHRIQPVMHTEVLPPRHFIPNPDGEGLIEISADELPMRTGKNRWWEVVQKEVPQTYEIQPRWRSEPEVIEGEPYITEEGFERRETTIIYPPKLEDMSGYEGAVQPVHFDHKTGERWLGEVTTMAELRGQYNQDMLNMKELRESLPDVSSSSSVRQKPLEASS